LGVAGNDLNKWAGLVDMDELQQDLPEAIRAEQVGLLTKRGQQQLESLGAGLRGIYVDRLGAVPAVFDGNSVSLRSTNFSYRWPCIVRSHLECSRTFLSTKHLISGFYPDTHPAVFLDKIKVQPHRNDHVISVDSLLVEDAVCKRLQAITKSSQQAPSLAGMQEEMRLLLALAKDRWKLQELTTLLAVSSGQPKLVPRHPESDGFFEVADVFFCRTCHQPSDAGDEEVEGLGRRFVQLSEESWRIFQDVLIANPQHSRLRSGLLVSELLEHMSDTIDDNKGNAKLMVLGAHDTTLAHLHGALGSGVYEWPAYASSLIFELWMSRDAAYVRAMWNGQAIRFPWASGELIPWGELVAYSHHLLPVDYASECLVY
jgi:hypothetical protein